LCFRDLFLFNPYCFRDLFLFNPYCFRDLFDFLTICFYEYEHFFKDHQAVIVMEEDLARDLLPLAYDIVYNHIRNMVSS
jgi:hypothetical protein